MTSSPSSTSPNARALLAVLFATAALSACGGSNDAAAPVPVPAPPPAPAPAPSLSVTRTTPSAEASGAEPSTLVELLFSDTLKAGAANTASIVLSSLPAHRRIRASVTSSGAAVTLLPAQPLSLLTRYELTLADTLSSASGLPFAGASSRFVTRDGNWDAAQTISTGTGANAYPPSIAVDSGGNAFAVWQQYRNAHRDVWVARFDATAGAWTTAQLLETDDTGDAVNVRIASGVVGAAVAVWQQSDGVRDNIWAARYGGDGWGIPQTIETGSGAVYQPRTAMDAAGNAFATWTQLDAGVRKVFANRFDAAAGIWGGVLRIENDATGHADAPDVVVDQAGNATAVWLKFDGSEHKLWASRFAPGAGTWSAPQLLQSDAGSAAEPLLAVDLAGAVDVVWRQFIGTAWQVRSARFVPETGVWSAPQTLDSDAAGASTDERLAVNASGDAVAVWSRTVGATTTLRATRRAAGGAWGAAEDVSATGAPRLAQVGIDDAGNAIAAWSQQQTGGVDHIVVSRFSAITGQWSPPSSLQRGGAASASDAAALAVNRQSGQALAAWPEFGGSHFEIVAARFK